MIMVIHPPPVPLGRKVWSVVGGIMIYIVAMIIISDQMPEQLHVGRFALVRIQVVVVSRSGRCCRR
jgi:hypothetical protein